MTAHAEKGDSLLFCLPMAYPRFVLKPAAASQGSAAVASTPG
jgi:hypothetical protein